MIVVLKLHSETTCIGYILIQVVKGIWRKSVNFVQIWTFLKSFTLFESILDFAFKRIFLFCCVIFFFCWLWLERNFLKIYHKTSSYQVAMPAKFPEWIINSKHRWETFYSNWSTGSTITNCWCFNALLCISRTQKIF